MKKIMHRIMTLAVALLVTAQTALGVTGVQLTIQGSDVVLTWPSQPCRIYIVGHRTAFSPTTPWTFLTTALPASAGSETTFTHSGAFQGGGGQQMAAAFGGESAPSQRVALTAEERAARIATARESAKKALAYLMAQLEAAIAKANAMREERAALLRAGIQPPAAAVAAEADSPAGDGPAGPMMSGSMGFYFVAEYAEDSDGDGLRNSIELLAGLDLLKADSDGDSIPDGNEDSDGDGVSNLEEVLSGTFINEADSEWPPPLLPFGTVFFIEENFTLTCEPSGGLGPAGGGGSSQDLLFLDASPDMAHGITAVETSPGVLNVKLHSIYIGPEFGVFGPAGGNPQNPFPHPSEEQMRLLSQANGETDIGSGRIGNIRQEVYDQLSESTLDWAAWNAEYGLRKTERLIQEIESGQRQASEALRRSLRANLVTQAKRLAAGTSSLARRFGRAVGRYLPFIGGIMILSSASAIAQDWQTAFEDYAADIRNGDDTTGSAAIIAALSNDLAPGSGNFVLNALLR